MDNTVEADLIGYIKACEEKIKKYGFIVQAVFPTEESISERATPVSHLPFAYSIGLHDQGIPELFVSTLPGEVAHTLITDVADMLLEEFKLTGAITAPREITHDNWPLPFYLIYTSEPMDLICCGAIGRSEYKAEVIQIVFPDKGGFYPWEADYDAEHCPQPVFGEA